MAVTTTSSHTAPASARTMLPSTRMLLVANRTTVRSVSVSAITTFEPPASTSSGPLSAASRCRNVATTCSVLVQVMTRCATGPTRSVVSGASGTALVDARTGENRSHPTPFQPGFMGLDGSLTCYAAFIRHVHRLRGHRRRGSPGIQRGAVLAGPARRFGCRRHDAGFDATRWPIRRRRQHRRDHHPSAAQRPAAGRGHPIPPRRSAHPPRGAMGADHRRCGDSDGQRRRSWMRRRR